MRKRKQTNMNNVQLFVDANMDITPEYANEINAILLKTTTFMNDKLLTAYENTPEDLNTYYKDMRSPSNSYHTAAIPPDGYKEAFENVFKQDKDILYLHFSGSCSSAAMNNIYIASKELKKQFPKRKLYLVDTSQISAGGRLVTDVIVDLIKNGYMLEQILEWCEKEIKHFALCFAVDDIKFMQRSGRVSKVNAFFGALLNIKPLARMLDDGKIEVFQKVKGEKNSAKHILKYAMENSNRDLIRKYGVVIGDSDNDKMADFLELLFKREYGDDLKVVRTKINPIIGVHSGPGAYGVAFYAYQR